MTRKTTTLAVLLSAGFAFAGTGAAVAQADAMPFSQVDTDNDGYLSEDELIAALGEERGAQVLTADANDDNMIDTSEAMGMYEDDPMIGTALADDDEDPDYRDEETPINAEDSAGDLESPEEMEDDE